MLAETDYAADFAKQMSSIEEVSEIIWELELNKTLGEVNKFLRLIQTVPATSASGEILSFSLKCAKNYMKYFQ